MPEAAQNRVRMFLRRIQSYRTPLPKMRTSSTNNKWEIIKEGEKENPQNHPLDLAFLISSLSLSMTIRKRSGDRGQPWRNPLCPRKKFEGCPLINIAKLAEDTQPIIQLVTSTDNPDWMRTKRRKIQSTLSKALIRSILRTITFNFLFLMECKHS